MPEDEYQELVYLFFQLETRIEQTLIYFTKHQEKLKNPDYQVLFQLALFNTDLLFKEFKQEGFSEKIASFLSHTYHQFKAENEVQACVFLSQMARYIENFCDEKDRCFAKIHFSSVERLSDLRKLLENKVLDLEERSVIYAELIASLRSKKSLSEIECQELVEGYAFLQKYPIPGKWKDSYVDKDIRQTIQVHAKAMKNYLCRPDKSIRKPLTKL